MNKSNNIFSLVFVSTFILTIISIQIVKADGWSYWEDATVDPLTPEQVRNSGDSSYYSYAREKEYGAYALPSDPNNTYHDLCLSYGTEAEVEVWTAYEETQTSSSVAEAFVNHSEVVQCWVWTGPGTAPGGYMEYYYTVHSGCNQRLIGGYYIDPAHIVLTAASTPEIWQEPELLNTVHITYSAVNYFSNEDPTYTYVGPDWDWGGGGYDYINGNWIYAWEYYLDIEDEVEVDPGHSFVGLLLGVDVLSTASASIGKANWAWGETDHYSEIWGVITDFYTY